MELLLNNDDNTIQDKLIELIEMNENIRILSPYLTKNKALSCILQKSNFKLKLVLNFDPKSIIQGSTCLDIILIKELMDSGHVIYNNSELHSKLYITEESVILGSSNFTDYGLRTRKESAILFKLDYNPKIYKECESYFESILESSTKVTVSHINRIIRILDDSYYSDNEKLELLSEIFTDNYIKNSLINDYESKYYYPKTLQELQHGLKFDFINYQDIENKYKAYFQGSRRIKDEIISFIRTELYEKNRGYNIKTKIDGSTPSIYVWIIRNESEFDFELKSYSDFYVDRALEVLTLYRKSFDIQPATGFFANKFEFLKDKGKIDDEFFSIKLSVFKEDRDFRLLKERLEEIDDFITRKGHVPNQYARTNIKTMKSKGNLSIYEERELKNEGRLRDNLYLISKKYNKDFYSQDSMKFIENCFNKWGWIFNEK